jgi:hypothetical protein
VSEEPSFLPSFLQVLVVSVKVHVYKSWI